MKHPFPLPHLRTTPFTGRGWFSVGVEQRRIVLGLKQVLSPTLTLKFSPPDPRDTLRQEWLVYISISRPFGRGVSWVYRSTVRTGFSGCPPGSTNRYDSTGHGDRPPGLGVVTVGVGPGRSTRRCRLEGGNPGPTSLTGDRVRRLSSRQRVYSYVVDLCEGWVD